MRNAMTVIGGLALGAGVLFLIEHQDLAQRMAQEWDLRLQATSQEWRHRFTDAFNEWASRLNEG